MWAVIVDKPGDPSVLTYRQINTPRSRPGWSLVRVRAAGVNHSEVFTRQGLSPNVRFPRVLGIECAGEVVESTTPSLTPGQTVVALMGEMGRAYDGGDAHYVLLPNERIFPVSTRLSWTDLGAIPETYATAYGSIMQLAIIDSMSILVRAASSGVGIAAVQLIKALYPNSKVTGTTRSPKKIPLLLERGYDRVCVEEDGKLSDRASYNRILDLIGPATLRDSFTRIEPQGIVCSTGQLGGVWELDHFDPIVDTRGGHLTGYHSADAHAALLQELIDTVENHSIDVSPQHVLPLHRAEQAHRILEQAHGYGKIVLVPQDRQDSR